MASPSDHHRQAGDPHVAFDDAEQGFAYIKPLWCLQAIIKPDGLNRPGFLGGYLV
jgi:hypothetical protein